MSSNDFDDDPFNEGLVISAICSLRNIPIPAKKVYKKRKKPEPKPKIHVTLDPRFLTSPPEHYVLLPEGDSRWNVPDMIKDCFISGDRDHFQQVMSELCTPDIEFLLQYDGKQNPYGPNTRYISGLSRVTDFGVAMLSTAPDMVALIYEPPTAFYDEKTDCSFGCFKCLTSATKIGIIVPSEQLISSSSGGNVHVEGNISKSASEYGWFPLPPSMPVIQAYQVARYTYTMNAEHKITKLCMLFKHMYPSTPPVVEPVPSTSKKETKKVKKRKLARDVVVSTDEVNVTSSGV